MTGKGPGPERVMALTSRSDEICSGPGAGSRFAVSFTSAFGLLVWTLFTVLMVPALSTLVARDRSCDEGVAFVRANYPRSDALVRIAFMPSCTKVRANYAGCFIPCGRAG